MKKPINVFRAFAVFLSLAFISPFIANADTKCVFTKTLGSGSKGSDVLCLQKYLNSNGYTISSSGVGSVGRENGSYGDKTKIAVKKWQIANGISPATGSFGPQSISYYQSKVASAITAVSSVITPTPTPTLTPTPTPTPSPTYVVQTSSSEKSIKETIKKLKEDIDKADDIIDDAEKDHKDISGLRDYLERARIRLIDGVYLYVSGDLAQAKVILGKARASVDDSVEDLVDENNKDDADDAIQSARSALSDAREKISVANNKGKSTSQAVKLYNEAKSKFDDAREAYDNEEYSNVIDLADEAEDLAENASDAL